jgi:hypothetical protein
MKIAHAAHNHHHRFIFFRFVRSFCIFFSFPRRVALQKAAPNGLTSILTHFE